MTDSIVDCDRFISEMIEIEGFLFDEVESQWITLPGLSLALVQCNHLTLNGLRIDGSQADELVRYFFLEYYRKIQEHYDKPNFRSEILDALERQFPDRSDFQIAVVKNPNNPDEWRIRKRLFKRLKDQKHS